MLLILKSLPPFLPFLPLLPFSHSALLGIAWVINFDMPFQPRVARSDEEGNVTDTGYGKREGGWEGGLEARLWMLIL